MYKRQQYRTLASTKTSTGIVLHKQRGITHEFGHMLGLNDEYLVTSTFSKDYKSIMHSGETILKRHDTPYMQWLNKNLPEE